MNNDLHEDLDRALRTVTFGPAPIEQAKRHGRRIRTRRRVAAVAGALAVAAIVAGYPVLARTAAAPPPPVTHKTHDPVLTDGPGGKTTQGPAGLVGTDGLVADGKVGSVKWQAAVDGPDSKQSLPGATCYRVTLSPGGQLPETCLSPARDQTDADHPVVFAADRNGTRYAEIGQAAPDVTYLIVTFTDGQQLKLIPVISNGLRYVAWVAPVSMVVTSVVAHLGGPYSDSGQTATAVPFDQPGQAPVFGLWQRAGQSAPPRAALIIGGTTGGQNWQSTAFEGPWGTCFVASPGTSECAPVKRLVTTAIIGWGGDSPEPVFGSAAPGVTLVRVALSNGKTAAVKPVGVGNERVFAFAVGAGVSPVSWTAYDASGHQVGAGSVKLGLAVKAP